VGVQADAIAMVEKTVEVFGRIDILVNNAGAGAQTAIQDTTPEAFASLLNVHLFGSFCTMWAAVAHMRAQNYGRIVNTSSALGAFSAPAACAYSTAKAAILGMSKSAALDNEDKDIRINAILPVAQTSDGAKAFFAKRPEIDGDRLLTSRVSPAVMYLCHRICSLTGEAIAAGGGRVARVFTATGPGYYSDELTDQEVADNLETIMDTTGFRILREALDQHRLLPPRGTKRP
jgi:NAD(P)-dependent dehydrogenase (short-subunit alcohol dehydrogenase family)